MTPTVIGLLVTPCTVVGKLTGFGVTVTAGVGGGGAAPEPERVTDCGLPEALSAIERVACCGPIAVGRNVMLMEQNFVG